MATTTAGIDTINTPNWQMSATSYGTIVTDGDDIKMSMRNILLTEVGELPLSPTFGCNLRQLIDLPTNKLLAAVTAEVIDAINRWEQRVSVSEVLPFANADYSIITFQLNVVVVSSASQLTYTFSLTNSKNNRRAFSDEYSTEAFG